MQPNKTNGYTREVLDRMCRKKHRWSDDLTARAAALQSLDRHPLLLRLFTYKCPVCKGIHLTRCKQPGQEPVMRPGEVFP